MWYMSTDRLQTIVGHLNVLYGCLFLSYIVLSLNHSAKVHTKNEKNERFVLIDIKNVKIFQSNAKNPVWCVKFS